MLFLFVCLFVFSATQRGMQNLSDPTRDRSYIVHVDVYICTCVCVHVCLCGE